MFIDRKTRLIKISVFPTSIYILITISIKILAIYYMDSDKIVLKFIWRGKRYRMANIILKENKVGGLMLPEFETY